MHYPSTYYLLPTCANINLSLNVFWRSSNLSINGQPISLTVLKLKIFSSFVFIPIDLWFFAHSLTQRCCFLILFTPFLYLSFCGRFQSMFVNLSLSLSLCIFYLCQLNFEQSLVGIISSWVRLQFFLFSTARKTQEIHSLLSTVSLSPSLVLPCTQRCSFSHSDSSSHHAADTHSCSFFFLQKVFFRFRSEFD